MYEHGEIEHSLIVEVRDKQGRLKSERYIEKDVEFVPNKLYMALRNKGIIKSNTFKIPILFGKRKKAVIPSHTF